MQLQLERTASSVMTGHWKGAQCILSYAIHQIYRHIRRSVSSRCPLCSPEHQPGKVFPCLLFLLHAATS